MTSETDFAPALPQAGCAPVIPAFSAADPAIDLVAIPAGGFLMGAAAEDKFATATERPEHRVLLSRPFAIGRCPVTVRQYRMIDPRHACDEPDDLPVVNVSWHDAADFCQAMRETTGRSFRLPSEAEWEYACRAGSGTPFSTGASLTPADANYLYDEMGCRIGAGRRTPVGAYPPNAFGVHDLHGNVCEWIEDAWHPNYAGAPADGRAWVEGCASDRRVIRGGAWDHLPRLLRSAWRDGAPSRTARDNLGFRVAMTLE